MKGPNKYIWISIALAIWLAWDTEFKLPFQKEKCETRTECMARALRKMNEDLK